MINRQIVPLECLCAGEHARILEVDGARDDVCRLAEIGFRQGVHVSMVRPGRPCILAIDNHRLSFRLEESASVMVEVCGSNGAPGRNGTGSE